MEHEKRPTCHSANTCHSFIPGWNMFVSQRACWQLPVPSIFSPPDAVIRFALLCTQKSGSEYSYPVLNSWMQIAKPAGVLSRKERDTHKRVAWLLELVSNCTQMSLLPAVNQLICWVLIHTFEIPRVEPLEIICWLSKDSRETGGQKQYYNETLDYLRPF